MLAHIETPLASRLRFHLAPMFTPLSEKASTEAIRARFDADVERFANLETGQEAIMDAALMLELIGRAAAAATPHATRLLDVGCGAGNQTLKLLQRLPDLRCDLLDLSRPMLERAFERVSAVSFQPVNCHHGDMRVVPLAVGAYDIIVAGAVLHHLRDDDDWACMFQKLYDTLAPGGTLWVSDMVSHDDPAIQALMWRRWGDHLTRLGGTDYRNRVFNYVEHEDSPRSLAYQFDLMRAIGFEAPAVLHKNGCFAAFGASKPTVDRQPTINSS